MNEFKIEESMVIWGTGAIVENGVDIAKVTIGPDRKNYTQEQWAAFEQMKHDNSTSAD